MPCNAGELAAVAYCNHLVIALRAKCNYSTGQSMTPIAMLLGDGKSGLLMAGQLSVYTLAQA